MGERIFSRQTKTPADPGAPGQGPVLNNGQTVDFDMNMTGFGPPISVQTKAEGGAGTVTRTVLGLVGNDEVSLDGPTPVTVGGAPNVFQIPATDGPFARLRVRLIAGVTAPDGRVQVQVNGTQFG